MSAVEMNIAGRLRELRKKNGYTQDQVAAGAGVKRSAYAAYEEGRAKPNLETAIQLARLYNFDSVEKMFCGKPRKSEGRLEAAYNNASKEARRIVDYILKINSSVRS